MRKLCVLALLVCAAPLAQAADEQSKFYIGGEYLHPINKVENVGLSYALQIGTRLSKHFRVEGEYMRLNLTPANKAADTSGLRGQEYDSPEEFFTELEKYAKNILREYDAKRYMVNLYFDKDIAKHVTAYAGFGAGRTYGLPIIDLAIFGDALDIDPEDAAILVPQLNNTANQDIRNHGRQPNWTYQVLAGTNVHLGKGFSVGPKFRYTSDINPKRGTGEVFTVNSPSNWTAGISVTIRPMDWF